MPYEAFNRNLKSLKKTHMNRTSDSRAKPSQGACGRKDRELKTRSKAQSLPSRRWSRQNSKTAPRIPAPDTYTPSPSCSIKCYYKDRCKVILQMEMTRNVGGLWELKAALWPAREWEPHSYNRKELNSSPTTWAWKRTLRSRQQCSPADILISTLWNSKQKSPFN